MSVVLGEPLRIKVFADGADLASIRKLASDPLIRGFTTNPTLMRQAGVVDYATFAKEVLAEVSDRPISFEVFSDQFEEMERQALRISSWGDNVYVKIPVTTTTGEPSTKLIRRLASDGIKLNVTAILTLGQVRAVTEALEGSTCAVVSVFAGRIADTGRDPVPLMAAARELVRTCPQTELLWASPREVLNIVQADAIGCDIITVTPDLLKKLATVGKELELFSLETVQMFYDDAQRAGYAL
jgi:transaldolase